MEFLIDASVLEYTIFAVLSVLILIGLRDILQNRSSIKHNFPIVGNLRYLLEMIGPELRQYWVANDKEEMPFNRSERSWVYATSKKQNNNFGFGTSELLYGAGYPIIKHKTFTFPEEKAYKFKNDPTLIPSMKVMGKRHNRKRPYQPTSIINISAMSYGSLGKNAVSSLNIGAKESFCMHNTGEGSISPYHDNGADLCWQIGTAYFGARTKDGQFSIEEMKKRIKSFHK